MIFDETAGRELTAWFEANKREMPWRSDPTPYHVWVSEIMLQQTRVDTVRPYYERFLRHFPTVEALAASPDDAVQKAWEGLGYYSRARNLHRAAKLVSEAHGGALPDTFEALRKLPGIGSYTAGAILSIAFGKPYPVVDGNVLRVLMRLHGRTDDIRDPKTKANLETELREDLLKTGIDPSAFNQGLMELGALVCVPNGKPHCPECPWKARCRACLEGRTEELPVESPKPEKTAEEKTVYLVESAGKIGLVKRDPKALLGGLYGLPETDLFVSEEALRRAAGKQAEITALPAKKHVFTHRIWEMKAYRITSRVLPEKLFRSQGGPVPDPDVFVTKEELEEAYPLPTAFKKWPLFCAAGETP